MADFGGNTAQKHPNLNLSPEEQRLYTQVFSAADTESIGVVTGDVAIQFLPEKTKLPSEILGEIWQIADTEDKGFLTPAGFHIILRLIGYAQAGRPISAELALKPGGPLPKFEGINTGAPNSPLQAQGTGGPIRVPPLAPDKAHQYATLFQQSGAQNGVLPGLTAKSIFDRAQLPHDILVKIWNLADTEERGMLSETEFIIAMHLLASYRSNTLKALPHNLPAGLYEAAARRGAPPPRPLSGSRQAPNIPPPSAVPRQLTGQNSQRPSSPLARQPYNAAPFQPQTTGYGGSDWVVQAQEKAQYDLSFDGLDTSKRGYVNGDEAAGFFGNSRLPEDDLAQIWDLADIKSEGVLNKDEFAVAMHLIRQRMQKQTPIPATLPANLIPPSMRSPRPQQASQVVPPTPPPKAKSAAEDLFGLDALAAPSTSSAPSQVPQSTGGSSAAPVPAPAQTLSPQNTQTSQPVQSNTFKPFVPSSSFGQSIVSPQPTGTSQSSASRGTPVNNDDLLGDTDPEINKRITNETTELANLSNQVSTLTNQMQDVKNKRGTAEQNMSQVNAQKRDFETRLSQLRSAYEQEARDLRSLEERLGSARNETQKLQADIAMVQHSHSTLQEQKQKVLAELEGYQNENTNLTERMKQVNTEISQLKPQLEKATSEARQQKGRVAINKKQLSTIEGERDRVKTDLDGATNEYNEATRELDEINKGLERQKSLSPDPAQGQEQVAVPNSAIATSPAASAKSQNTNPFFRRTTTGMSQQEAARSPFTPENTTSPNHSAFDNFFGSAMPAPGPFSPPTQAPPTSFGINHNDNAPVAPTEGNFDKSPAESDVQDSSKNELPSFSHLPPPPPQSRQITSSSLPLREAVVGPPSESSSIGVAPPASRFGDSGNNTPIFDRQASSGPSHVFSPLGQNATGDSLREDAISQNTSSGIATPQDSSHNIPGSFPGDETVPTSNVNQSQDNDKDDPFSASLSTPKEPTSAKDDFDSAFAGFDTKGKAPESQGAFTPPKPGRQEEFPPIQEFDNDESDSDSENAFDDNFNPSVAPGTTEGKGKDAETVQPNAGTSAEAPSDDRPTLLRNPSTIASQLPTPNAQAPPPTYDQAMPVSSEGRKDSNQFPPEFGGLLPSRDDPTSPKAHVANDSETPAGGQEAQAAGTAVYSPPSASTPVPEATAPSTDAAAKPAPAAKTPFDEFDDAFGDLSEANAADDKGDDDFVAQRDNHSFDDFNPTFDSPAPSKTTTSSAFQDSAFNDFDANAVSSTNPGSTSTGNASSNNTNHDWDSMFANLGDSSSQPNGGSASQHLAPSGGAFGSSESSSKPPLARAVSAGTEHDDPILKRLTAMGYPRDESLAALEKFDYNLDKAADYLTSKA